MLELAARKERERQQEEKRLQQEEEVKKEREQAAIARRVAMETFDYEHSPLQMYDDKRQSTPFYPLTTQGFQNA